MAFANQPRVYGCQHQKEAKKDLDILCMQIDGCMNVADMEISAKLLALPEEAITGFYDEHARMVAAGRHRFLCPSSSAIRTDIASSSFRELDAVALATDVTIFMERGTYPRASPEDAVNGSSFLRAAPQLCQDMGDR